MVAIAIPLYTVPAAELSIITVAVVPPFQAETVPSSVQKMNDALVPLASRNPVVLFCTCPVAGAGDVPPAAPGMVTTVVEIVTPVVVFELV